MSANDILVLAETRGDKPADVTYELLAAARSLASAGGQSGGQVTALLLCARAGEAAAQLRAADRIIVVEDPLLSDYSPEPYLAAAAEVIAAERPRVVLTAATSVGWDLAPLLAAKLNTPLVTGCKELRWEDEELIATASFCGGKMLAECSLLVRPAILMMLPGAYRPTEAQGAGMVEQRRPSAPLSSAAIRFDEWLPPPAGDIDITQQDILVAVGRGIQQKDNLELAETLAQTLGGAVCASRPVVDQGWLPSTRQVGKSGMTVKPKLYLALGISGAPEHQEGMKGAELIIAVNTDPKAPIFDIAHFGAQLDILELLPALNDALTARKQ